MLNFVSSDRVLSKREGVFSDVKEEFSDVSSIKAHLEQWKFSFPSSYSQAYLSFCLPKLFSPFVRLELLSWNPLNDEGGVLEDARWFNVLMFYGFLEGAEPERDDEDILLIPNIVEKAVLPKLTGEIAFDNGLHSARLASDVFVLPFYQHKKGSLLLDIVAFLSNHTVHVYWYCVVLQVCIIHCILCV